MAGARKTSGVKERTRSIKDLEPEAAAAERERRRANALAQASVEKRDSPHTYTPARATLPLAGWMKAADRILNRRDDDDAGK